MSEGRLDSFALYTYTTAFAQRHWDNKVKAAKLRGQDLFALAWTPPGGRTFVYQVCCPSGQQPDLEQLVQLVKENNKPWCSIPKPTRQLRSACSARADLGTMDGPGKHARADSASDVRVNDASPYKHEPAHGCFQLSEDVPEQLRLSQWSDYSAITQISNQAELGPTELPDSNLGKESTVAALPRFHHKYHSSSSSLGHANSWGGVGWGNSWHAQSFGGASGLTCSLASRGPTASPKQSCGGPKEASSEEQQVKAIITPQQHCLIRPSDSSDVLALEESRRCWGLVRLGSKGGVVGEEEEEPHTKEAAGGKQKKRCNCRQRFVQVLKLLAGGCIFGGRCM